MRMMPSRWCRNQSASRGVANRDAEMHLRSAHVRTTVCPRWERARRCALERAGAGGARWRAGNASRFAASRSFAIVPNLAQPPMASCWKHLLSRPLQTIACWGLILLSAGAAYPASARALGILAILILILILPDLRSALCRREQMSKRWRWLRYGIDDGLSDDARCANFAQEVCA